jgi:hypothetical protein
MAIRVTLGDQALSLIRPITWGPRSGTVPRTEILEVHEDEADVLRKKMGQPVSLVIHAADSEKAIYKALYLYLVAEVGGSLPFYRGFVLADRRWRWPRILIHRAYNLRWRTGERRRLATGAPIQQQPVIDDVAYRDYSLKDGKTRWKAREIVEDVLNLLVGDAYAIDGFPARELVTDSVEIEDQGHGALARALSYAPGADVYVDDEGTIRVYDSVNQANVGALLNQRPEVFGQGHPVFARYGAIRPSKVRVHFVREQELRFDSLQEDDTRTTAKGTIDRLLENVVQIPDLELTLGNGDVATTGEWIEMGRYLAALNAIRPATATIPLTFASIQKYWFTNTLWAQYASLGNLEINAAWAVRIAAIRYHYRRTYRIPTPYMSRIRSWKSYRVALADVETSTYADAPVYTDFAVRPNAKFQNAVVNGKDSGRVFMFLNVHGYPGSPTTLLSAGNQAPARVQMVDQQLGIFRIEFEADMFGNFASIEPSFIVDDAGGAGTNVTFDFAQALKYPIVAGDAKVEGVNGIALSSTHRVAVVVTAVPAAPNSTKQLYRRDVAAADVVGLVSGVSITPTNGPEWDVMIAPMQGRATARFVWTEDFAESIGNVFGVVGNVAAPLDFEPPANDNLLVNEDVVSTLAKAAAAMVYARLTDRWQGTKTVHLAPEVHPTGALSTVDHRVLTNGAALTTLMLPTEISPIDLFSMLPSSVRAKVFAEVQP